MEIKIVDRSGHNIPEYSVGKNVIMKNLCFIVLIFIILTGSGCSARMYKGGNENVKGTAYDSATFSYFYGEALKQKLLGNAGDAIKYLEQCVKINPKSDAAYYQLAQITLQRGDMENGKEFAIKAVKLDEKNLWYLTMLGDIYYQEKNMDSAAVYYEKARKIS